MASAERTLFLLHPRPSALLSSIHSHQNLKNHYPHSNSLIPISLTNAFLPSLFYSHGLQKRVSHRRKPITILCRIYRCPARDIVIDFGRYKGSMMGTLPSKYLQWMAKDPVGLPTEANWAKLAKEVLDDSYYRDRMEWETIEEPLQKTRYPDKKSGSGKSSYLRLATRFGWDLTASWKDVDLKFLGTTKGGRIPRTKDCPVPNLRHDYYLQKEVILGPMARFLASENTKDRNLVAGKSEDLKAKYDGENGYGADVLKRRDARRGRQKARGVSNINMRPQFDLTKKDGPVFPGRGALLRKLAEAEAQAEANKPKWPKM